MRPHIYSTPRSFLWAMAAAVFSMFLMTGAQMLYTNHTDKQSNQAWCDIINGLHTRYQALPADAATEAKVFAGQIAALKKRYDC